MKYSLRRKPKFAYIRQHIIRYPVGTQARSIGICLELNDGTTQYFHKESDAWNYADLHGWQLIDQPISQVQIHQFYDDKS